MLSIFITDTDGEKRQLESVISVVLNSEGDVPADDLTVTLLYDKSVSDKSDMITAVCDNKVVFYGKVDEVINLFGSRQIVTKICARNLAGLLLDNEAEPIAFYKPSADYIFRRYAKPYGIVCNADDEPLAGLFRVDKGMSEWQVIESFCRQKYGAVPKVTGSGELLLKGFSMGKKITFGEGGVKYSSLRESNRRCELISEIKLKMNVNTPYTSHIKNKNPACKGINRVRYLNTTADNTTLSTADRIIENSNLASYSITLECCGCFADILGCSAEVVDNRLGRIEKLVVDKLKYSLGADGEFTTVTLRKEI